MPFFLTIHKGRLIDRREATAAPTIAGRPGVIICEDTPANRAKYLRADPVLTSRQQAAAAVAAILEGLRQQGSATLELRGVIAQAWANINALLDLDKPSALDAFDALVPSLPSELQAHAPGLRALLAAI